MYEENVIVSDVRSPGTTFIEYEEDTVDMMIGFSILMLTRGSGLHL
jgi:hypothetical protein